MNEGAEKPVGAAETAEAPELSEAERAEAYMTLRTGEHGLEEGILTRLARKLGSGKVEKLMRALAFTAMAGLATETMLGQSRVKKASASEVSPRAPERSPERLSSEPPPMRRVGVFALERQLIPPDQIAELEEASTWIKINYRTGSENETLDLAGSDFERNSFEFVGGVVPYGVEVMYELPGTQAPGQVSKAEDDGNGNKIRAVIIAGVDNSQVIAKVETRPMFSDGPEAEMRDLTVDLTRLGGPKLEKLVRVETIPMFAEIGPGAVYKVHATSEEAADMGRVFVEHGDSVAAGISETEKLFGLKPGEGVQRILVAESAQANAFAQTGETGSFGTVLFNDKLLRPAPTSGGKPTTPKMVRLVSRHEAVHVLDRKFEISDSFGPAHRAFSPAFLQKISESKFISGAFGGHAWNNSREMVASLMNAVMNEEWDKGTAKMTIPEIRELATALQMVAARLQEIPELRNAPILELVLKRLRGLETEFKLGG